MLGNKRRKIRSKVDIDIETRMVSARLLRAVLLKSPELTTYRLWLFLDARWSAINLAGRVIPASYRGDLYSKAERNREK